MNNTALEEIQDHQLWDTYDPLVQQGIFLQSSPQKSLYESMGQKTWLFAGGQQRSLRSLVTKVEARRGTFLYLPYGPNSTNELSAEELKTFFAELKTLARQEGAAFIRISPFWPEESDKLDLLKEVGFRKAPLHMLAETPWLLSLKDRSEEEMMAGMDKKHRNLVRRAIKEGVEVRQTRDPEALDRFVELLWETVKRHQFTPYPKSYFRGQVESFGNRDEASIFEAWYDGKLLASAIIMYYGDVAAYHHGASTSDPAYRKIPASYLLQWEAIQEAMRRGCSSYNFWGIAPEKNPKHPFYGITHFKTGFGGERKDLVPCHDLVVSPKYFLNWAVETFRKWKRGF